MLVRAQVQLNHVTWYRCSLLLNWAVKRLFRTKTVFRWFCYCFKFINMVQISWISNRPPFIRMVFTWLFNSICITFNGHSPFNMAYYIRQLLVSKMAYQTCHHSAQKAITTHIAMKSIAVHTNAMNKINEWFIFD